MNMTLPNDSDLRRVLPQIQSITMLDKGGFKANGAKLRITVFFAA
jgi:hypothetical protein